jgi:hypothetical protein
LPQSRLADKNANAGNAYGVLPSKDPADFVGRLPSWLSRLPFAVALLGVLAAIVWFAAFIVFISSNWYLECAQGSGIDCLDALPGSAKTDSPLAGWIGAVGLSWVLAVATVVLVGCAIATSRMDR